MNVRGDILRSPHSTNTTAQTLLMIKSNSVTTVDFQKEMSKPRLKKKFIM